MTLHDVITRRQIVSVLHFTTNRGLVGTLAVGGLLSRHRLAEEHYLEHVLHVNSAHRPEASADFDKSENWLDYVNLSISEINTRFLHVSKRWHNNSSVSWCIMDYCTGTMEHDGVFFATTNNSYPLCRRQTGLAGLQALFAGTINRKPGWMALRADRPPHLPTCEQAEVLYPRAISNAFLQRIYVEHAVHQDVVRGWLQDFSVEGVDVVLSPNKFRGSPN